MTTYELRRHLLDILDALSIEHVLTKYLFILARGHEQTISELSELLYLKNRTVFSKKQQSSSEQFFELRRQAETFPLGQVFHEAIELQRTLAEKEDLFDEEYDKTIRELRFQAERFYKAFETFARTGSDNHFAEVMMEAGVLYANHAATRKAFSTVTQALLTDEYVPAGQSRLALYYPNDRQIGGIIEKLSALERAYQHLCALTGKSPSATPLQVVKLEANDLWVVVQGDADLVDVLSLLLEQFVQFVYSRFNTTTPAIQDISERVITTQTLVSLTDVLERKGFRDTVADTARLQKGAKAMRRELVLLIAEDPELEINGTLYGVDERSADQYRELSRSFLPPNRVLHGSMSA